MNKLILIVLVLFIISPVLAGDKVRQKDVPYFTNQDLEKYKIPSDTKPAEDTESVKDAADFKSYTSGDKGEKQELKRYVIPYKRNVTAMEIIIPVTINERVTVPMLLDTGASNMHISYKLAEKLGILDREEEMLWIGLAGVGGVVPAIYTILDSVQVGEAETRFIPTTISDTISSNFEGLIGMNFMANYSLQIDTKKQEVIFEELPARADMPAGHNEKWWRITFRNFSSMKLTWEKYREYLDDKKGDSHELRKLRKFADHQYEEAKDLYDRLWVYASENAVPLEWRE